MTHTHKPGKNKTLLGLISLVVVCALAFVAMPSFVYAADSPVVAQGENGGCVWEKAENGVLTVKVKDGADGQLESMKFISEVDGNGNKNRLTKIVFEKGVKAPEDMYQAFYACEYVTEIDLSKLDTSKTTNMGEMFKNCGNLQKTLIKGIDTSNVTDMHEMFYGCKSLKNSVPTQWNAKNVTNVNSMYMGCSTLGKVIFGSGWTFENVVDMGHMFDGCSNLTELKFIKAIDTSSVKDMSYLFNDCSKLQNLEVTENLKTNSVTNMDHMFNHCVNLKSINVRTWNTSNVTDMSNMFSMCSNLQFVFLGNGFDTSNVKSMDFMFYRDAKLSGLNVASFNTSNVESMTEMFNGCSKAKSLNVSNWDTAKCKSTKLMFANCTSLSELDLGNWDLKAAQANSNQWEGMFEGCNLKALNLGSDLPMAEALVVTPGDPFAGAMVSHNGQQQAGIALWMVEPQNRTGIWTVKGYTPSDKLKANEAVAPEAPAGDPYKGAQGIDLKLTLQKVTNGENVLDASKVITVVDGVNTINGEFDFAKDIVVAGSIEGPAGLDNALGAFKKLPGVVVLDDADKIVAQVAVETNGLTTNSQVAAARHFTATIKANTLESGKQYTLKFATNFATCNISDPSGWGFGEPHSLGSDVLFNLGAKQEQPTEPVANAEVTFTVSENAEGKKVLEIGVANGTKAQMTDEAVKAMSQYNDAQIVRVADGCTVVLPADASGMFQQFRKAEAFNLKGFDTSKTQNMSKMFWFCEKAESSIFQHLTQLR